MDLVKNKRSGFGHEHGGEGLGGSAYLKPIVFHVG